MRHSKWHMHRRQHRPPAVMSLNVDVFCDNHALIFCRCCSSWTQTGNDLFAREMNSQADRVELKQPLMRRFSRARLLLLLTWKLKNLIYVYRKRGERVVALFQQMYTSVFTKSSELEPRTTCDVDGDLHRMFQRKSHRFHLFSAEKTHTSCLVDALVSLWWRAVLIFARAEPQYWISLVEMNTT